MFPFGLPNPHPVPITRGYSGHVSLDMRSTVTNHPIAHSPLRDNDFSLVSPFRQGARAVAPASAIQLSGSYTNKERERRG